MEQLPENVRRFYDERAEVLTGDVWEAIGAGKELDELPGPEDFDPLPPAVLEAIGYYYTVTRGGTHACSPILLS